jgi:uncharacterized protein YhbP (UPF0306 family)
MFPLITDSPFNELLSIPSMTLATVNAQGIPHAAPVYFAVTESWTIYYFSDPKSQHGQDLSGQSQAAVAIYPETKGWQDIRGLQLHGVAAQLEEGPEWSLAWRCYLAKFPFVALLKPIVARNALYRYKPHWLRLVDNRRGIGFKREWQL